MCLQVAAIVLENITVNEEKTSDAASRGYLNATELADYLVKKGVPFRIAHEQVGKAVLFGIEHDKELHELSLAELRRFSPKADRDVFAALSLERTLSTKNAIGGTSPKRVAAALKKAKNSLKTRSKSTWTKSD